MAETQQASPAAQVQDHTTAPPQPQWHDAPDLHMSARGTLVSHGSPDTSAAQPPDGSQVAAPAARSNGPSAQPQSTAATADSSVRLSWPELPKVLQLLPPWLKWPEYYKVENINAMIGGLWPYLSRGTEALVHEQFAAWADEFVAQQGRGILVGLSLDVLDLGCCPLRLEAVKVNQTEEDELIFEGPLSWASTMRVRASAHCKLLRWTFKLPMEVRNLQMKVHARIIARPIRETPPFISSITISLLEKPHLDFDVPVKLPASLFDPLQLGQLLSVGSVQAWKTKHGKPPSAAAPAAAAPSAAAAAAAAAAAGQQPSETPAAAGAAEGAARQAVGREGPVGPAPAGTPAAAAGAAGAGLASAAGGAEAAAPAAPEPEPSEVDLMALPLVNEGFRMAAGRAAEALLMYPRGYTVELVPGGAQRQWPEGMLEVKLIKITGLKGLDLLGTSEPYCVLQVREGRMNSAKAVKKRGGVLEFNEEFMMLVDSIQEQSLRLVVKDTEWGREDRFLGAADLPLKQASFIYLPGTRVPFTMDLHKVRARRSWGIITAPFNLLLSTSTKVISGVVTAGGSELGDQDHPGIPSAASASPHADSQAWTGDVSTGSPRADQTDKISRGSRGGRDGLRPQRSQSHPELSFFTAQGSSPAGNRGSDDTSAADQDKRVQPGAAAKGEQHAALDEMAQAADRAVRAGHQEEDEVEAVADFQRQRHEGLQQEQQQQRQDQQGQQQEQEKQGQDKSAQHAQHGEGHQYDAEVTGTAFLEAVWTPFKRHELPPECVGRPGFGSGLGPPLAYQCDAHGHVDPSAKGILTVTLLRAINVTGWEGEPDIYVKFVVHDKVQRKHYRQKSSVIYNEPHPRWGEKYDYAIISAGSVLRATVMDKTTPTQRLALLQLKAEDKELGHVHIPVQRVAAAGRIKHEWALAGAEQGALELVLEWFPESVTKT